MKTQTRQQKLAELSAEYKQVAQAFEVYLEQGNFFKCDRCEARLAAIMREMRYA